MAVRFGDRRADLIQLLHIHLQRQRAAAHTLDLFRQVGGTVLPAKAERDVGAGIRQRQGTGPTEPAGRSCHQCDLPAEIEAWKSISHFFSPYMNL
jgi:hypothetical protein